MLRSILAAAILLLAVPSQSRAQPALPTDQAAHFGVGYILVDAPRHIFDLDPDDPRTRPWFFTTMLICGALAFAKEAYDVRTTGFNHPDLTATLAGGVSAFTLNLIEVEIE